MKRGFTLIELLITVSVMVTLMAITFRLSSVSDAESKRTTTVIRLQKLENCLSGYYAAFGSYPPVQLHGTRDIFARLDDRTGMQTDEQDSGSLNWKQVEAACRSQPVGCAYPPEEKKHKLIDLLAEELVLRKQAGMIDMDVSRLTSGLKMPSVGEFSGVWDEYDWRVVQLFKFGLMSYLLPRYLVMTKSDDQFFGGGGRGVPKQWSVNNTRPVDATTGQKVEDEGLKSEQDGDRLWNTSYKYDKHGRQSGNEAQSWLEVFNWTETEVDNNGGSGSVPKNRQNYVRISNMPSQAVCARWITNLEGICMGWSSHDLFGVEVSSATAQNENTAYNPMIRYMLDHPWTLEVYTTESGASYTLDFVKVLDGYENEFYYYSPSGFQSYTLWSAGPNGKTFPPWLSISDFRQFSKTIEEWSGDDIIRMKN